MQVKITCRGCIAQETCRYVTMAAKYKCPGKIRHLNNMIHIPSDRKIEQIQKIVLNRKISIQNS